MEPKTIAHIHALGRVAIGAAMTVVPERAAGPWIGSSATRPGVSVITSAMGVRDLVLGAGEASAVRNGGNPRPWLRACVASDVVDLVATLRAREEIPTGAALGVAVVATTSIAVGAWLHATL